MLKEKRLLTERQKQILKAIVDDYVTTAEPVGSKALVEGHNLHISSATVRNEMSELEELGYLDKTHTSSGRIPSDKGYRAYVDYLLQVKPISVNEQKEIESFFNDHMSEIMTLIKRSVNVLSEQTNFPAMMVSPYHKESSLEQIKFLMIEPGKVLIVVVLSPGIVKDRLIRIPTVLNQSQLSLINQMIEEQLTGKKVEQITLISVSAAAENAPIPEPILNQILFEAYISIKQAENIEFYIEGTHRLLSQPEFKEISTAQKFLETMHHKGVVAGYMSEWDNDKLLASIEPKFQNDQEKTNYYEEINKRPSYMVRIGQEIALQGLEDCSFITATYKVSDKITGRIGVVGPKRMSYDKIIAQINFVNHTLDKEILELTQTCDPEEDKNVK